MHPLLISLLPLLPVAPSCMTQSGKTACGYHCIAAHGEVGCAQTEAGVCGATERELVCWDPPDAVRAHYGEKVPPAQCQSKQGQLACGYHCQTRETGDVRCANTPDGICVATRLGITCWDPPVFAYCADSRPLPRPLCMTVDGNAACGYGCKARNGVIRCAQTPGGQCQVFPQDILCTDPAPVPMCGGQPCRPDGPDSARSWCRPKSSELPAH